MSFPRRLTLVLAGIFVPMMLAGCGDEGGPSENSATSPTEEATSTTMTSPPATLEENESPYDFEVVASPPLAAVGSAITITAQGCDEPEEVTFADRQTVDAGASGLRTHLSFQVAGETVTSGYTVSPEDSIGGAVVTVRCSNGEGSASVEVVPG